LHDHTKKYTGSPFCLLGHVTFCHNDAAFHYPVPAIQLLSKRPGKDYSFPAVVPRVDENLSYPYWLPAAGKRKGTV
jgi:hypothetical protein